MSPGTKVFTSTTELGARSALTGKPPFPTAVSLALALSVCVLWGLMHHYQGFARDGELYAFQAAAKLDPTLGVDLYLQHTSQDRYTLFSRLYALCIKALGLPGAELLLFAICTAGFLTAAWWLARELFGRGVAWLALALLATTTGYYGAYKIFHYSENYLTARSLAEAMVVAALAVHYAGKRGWALAVAGAAMLIHPLMALPGLLLLICLALGIRKAASATLLGVLAVALAAEFAPSVGLLARIDPAWLDVVRQRSQFLFLEHWHLADWQLHARPVLCLILSALVLEDPRIRHLCVSVMLVGGAGLAVALIAGSIGPCALFLQGQAWRWFWLTGFVAVLLVAPTAVAAWRAGKSGPICATLLICAWTFSGFDGTAAAGLALGMWTLRSRFDERAARWALWAAYGLLATVAAWAIANGWTILHSPPVQAGHEPMLFERLRSLFGMQAPAVAAFVLLWSAASVARHVWVALGIAALAAVSLVWILPESFGDLGAPGTARQIAEFSDWRAAVPPASNVLIVPTRNSASFIWFTLGRPSYLSVDQSSGVVFSRETALEVVRRSQVLLPIMEPDWMILSQITQEAHGKKLEGLTQPLTAPRLAAVCSDPQLGFVIAKENLGFSALRHTHPGVWKDWNLYDCGRVRSEAAST